MASLPFPSVSAARLVSWCRQYDWQRVALRCVDDRWADELDRASIEVCEWSAGSNADAALMLDDTFGAEYSRDRADAGEFPGAGVIGPRGSVLVDASCPAAGRDGELELTPLVVDVDRVVLLTASRHQYRRIDIADGAISARVVEPIAVERIDDAAAAADLQLVARSVDWTDTPFRGGAPCHLSWFRNTEAEPGPVRAASHR